MKLLVYEQFLVTDPIAWGRDRFESDGYSSSKTALWNAGKSNGLDKTSVSTGFYARTNALWIGEGYRIDKG